MTKLPRVLNTFASALAFVQVFASGAVAQTHAQPERAAREERPAPEGAEDANVEKAKARFEGLSFFDERSIRGELRDKGAIVGETFDCDPARIEKAVHVLKKFYASRGFLKASVEAREESWSKPRLLTFVVSEGERSRLEEIRFEGARRVASARLAEAAQGCLARIAEEEEDWRDAYEYQRLEYCVREAREVFMGEGFLEAKTGEPRVEALGRGLRVTVPVEEGRRYRLGKVKVSGATVFLPEQVVEMLDVREGEVADGLKIRSGLWRGLTEGYSDRGYVGCEYEVSPVYKPAPGRKGEGVVDFKIEILEGKRFTVSSVNFKGNSLKTEGELKSAFSLKEGEVFSLRRLQEGLEGLRRTGVFDGYFNGTIGNCNYKDIDVSENYEEGTVAIKIYVNEASP